jgi:hypothetical protein
MTYTVTYVRRKGNSPISVGIAGYDEEAARAVAEGMAESMSSLTLLSLDDSGFPSVVARWENGQGKRTIREIAKPAASKMTVIEGEFTATDETETDDDADIAAAAEADSGETYNGYCVKCHEKRDFHGEIHVSDNGTRMAQGPCPVCGTKMNRILGKPKPLADSEEDFHTPDDEPEAPAEEAAETPVEESEEDAGAAAAEEMAETIVEAVTATAEGAPLPEVAEAVAVAAVEFSAAAEEAQAEEKPAPRKRAAKKAAPAKATPAKAAAPAKKATSRVTDEEIAATQKTEVAVCPNCQRKTPVKVGGSTGIKYLMSHPARTKDGKATGANCVGSMATVTDDMLA